MTIYKLRFESVSALGASGRFYDAAGYPRCTPEEVPDEYWSTSERETDDPWDQFNTLAEWAATGEQLIRNVELFQMESEPTWVPVEAKEAKS